MFGSLFPITVFLIIAVMNPVSNCIHAIHPYLSVLSGLLLSGLYRTGGNAHNVVMNVTLNQVCFDGHMPEIWHVTSPFPQKNDKKSSSYFH